MGSDCFKQFLFFVLTNRVFILIDFGVRNQNVEESEFIYFGGQGFEKSGITTHRDPVVIEGLDSVVPVDHHPRDDHQEEDEDNREHDILVVNIDEEVRETDTDSERTLTVGVAELETVSFLLLVGETFVALGDEDELVLRLCVSLIFVRVILQG